MITATHIGVDKRANGISFAGPSDLVWVAGQLDE
jgi:hypothetical protein